MKTQVSLEGKCILVTGGAGFIGSNLIIYLLRNFKNIHIVNLDLLSDYNSLELKKWRLQQIEQIEMKKNNNSYNFIKGDISDKKCIDELFCKYNFSIVANLAAQAGVRYSIENPEAYIRSNIMGFFNILEACRYSYTSGGNGVEHLVYASSSSVYGLDSVVPYSENEKADSPASLYAATKKSDELLAYSYSKLYNIPMTGLRFFTVYGPAGRTDMAYFSFTEKLLEGERIKIYNYGNCKRDFTYIDDVVEAFVKVMQGAPTKKIGEDGLPIPPYAIYNIGNQNPVNLLEFVTILEEELIRAGLLENYDGSVEKELVPMQPGDVVETYADCSMLEKDYNYKTKVNLGDGLRKFVEWYKEYIDKYKL